MRWRHASGAAALEADVTASLEPEAAEVGCEPEAGQRAAEGDSRGAPAATPADAPRKRWGRQPLGQEAASASELEPEPLIDARGHVPSRESRRGYWPLAVEQAADALDSEDEGLNGASLAALGIGTSSRARISAVADEQLMDHLLDDPASVTALFKFLEEAEASGGGPEVDLQSLVGASDEPRVGRKSARRRAKARREAEAAEGPGGCVVLVREDCRLHDNPALYQAALDCAWVLPLYVHDDGDPSPWPVRGAGLWWRHESLQYFDKSLGVLGSRITYRRGAYVEQIVDVMLESGAKSLYFNRQLEPWHIDRDRQLESAVRESLGLQVKHFKAMVCAFEPWDAKQKGEKRGRIADPLPAITKRLTAPPSGWPWSLELRQLGYCKTGGRRIPPGFRQYNEARQRQLEARTADPKEDDWAYEMRRFWKPGEHAAMERLEEWLKDAAWGCYFPPGLNPKDAVGGRFRADRRWTAILSPYLRFGDLSPRYVYARCRQALPFELRRLFTKRVVWRDKAYAQLYRWPESHTKSIRSQYENERWSGTRLQLRRWQRGETGFPLVDAAMRQLWKVGWMCNHLRHVTAQFLIEHLDLSWKDGFAWYDYTLVDTDVAINAMMWQMGGHSGIGAWNFVMHPIYAGKKVDPEGHFVRRWLPELAHLPVEYIHCPWEAPAGTRISANVLINGVYWQRVIEDLLAARKIHQVNVIEVRKRFPQFVQEDGTEIIPLGKGRVLRVEVRDDIRENDEDKVTLLMTPDDPRSTLRRNLGTLKGVHQGLIYDETKRFEAMYDALGDF